MSLKKYLIWGLLTISSGFVTLQAADAAYEPRVVFEDKEEPSTLDSVWRTDWRKTVLQANNHDFSVFRTLKDVNSHNVVNEKSFQDLQKRVDDVKQGLIQNAKSIGLDEQDPAVLDLENQAHEKKSMLTVLKQKMVDDVNQFNDYFPINLDLQTPQGKRQGLAFFGLQPNYTQEQLDQAYLTLKKRIEFNARALGSRGQDASERLAIIHVTEQRLKLVHEAYDNLKADLSDKQPVGLSAKQEQSPVWQPAEQPKQIGVAKALDEQKEELPKKEDVRVGLLPKAGQDQIASDMSVAPKMIQEPVDILWNEDFKILLEDLEQDGGFSFYHRLLHLDPQLDYNNYATKIDLFRQRLEREKVRLENKIKANAVSEGLSAEEVRVKLADIKKHFEKQDSDLKLIEQSIDKVVSDYTELNKQYSNMVNHVKSEHNLNKVVEWFGFKDLEGFSNEENRLESQYEECALKFYRYRNLLEFWPTKENKVYPSLWRMDVRSMTTHKLRTLLEWYEAIKAKLTSDSVSSDEPVSLAGLPDTVFHVKKR